jgi:heme exporter protein C
VVRFSRVAGAGATVALAATLVLGLAVPDTEQQGATAPLIAIHPALAWAAYLAFAVTAAASALYLWPRTRRLFWDLVAGASAEIGVVFTALTLVTGSIWGRATWGVWWTWDARLTLTALIFALYLGYLALRRVPAAPDVRAQRCAVAALLAAIAIPVNHFAVDWWRTLHQGRSFARPDPQSQLDPEHLTAMLVGFIAITLSFLWLLLERYRVEVLEERLDAAVLDRDLDARRREAAAVAPEGRSE